MSRKISKLFRLKSEETIVSSVIERERVDRTSLSRITGMSLSAVSRIVRNLIHQGILEEVGETVSSGGRKPILLRFNAEYRFAVGIKIALGYANILVTNLIGRPIVRMTHKFDPYGDPESIMTEIVQSMKRLFISQGIELEKIIGVGVAVSGSIDHAGEILEFSGLLGWKDINISKIVRDTLKIPAFVLNDVKSFSIAQLWKGETDGCRNFMTVTIGTGLGMGMIIEGKLYTGLGNAGEFGHIMVNPGGKRCSCGRDGCLETEVSFHALIENIDEISSSETIRESIENRKKVLEEVELGILRMTREKDFEAFSGSFEKLSKYLGVAIVDLVNIFNPPLIIIGGEILEFEDQFMERLAGYVREKAFGKFGNQLKIKKDSIGEDSWTLGVIYLLIERAFGRDPIVREAI